MRLFLANHFSQQIPLSFAIFFAIAIFLGASCKQLPDIDRQDITDQFTIQEGFEIELFAAEPLVQGSGGYGN